MSMEFDRDEKKRQRKSRFLELAEAIFPWLPKLLDLSNVSRARVEKIQIEMFDSYPSEDPLYDLYKYLKEKGFEVKEIPGKGYFTVVAEKKPTKCPFPYKTCVLRILFKVDVLRTEIGYNYTIRSVTLEKEYA